MRRDTIVAIGLIFSLCALGSGSVGCGGDGSTSTLSGTIYFDDAPDGVKAYLKLVARGADSSAAPLYFAASTTFSGGQATYTLSDVENGSYTGYAFIDMNENAAGDSTSMPDNGDYVTDGGNDIDVDGDRVEDIPDQAWVTYSD